MDKPAQNSQKSDSGLTFGLRAHDGGKRSPPATARAVAALGASSVQLAPQKAFTQEHADECRWSIDEAERVGSNFRDHGLDISVLGCYHNILHPDTATRQKLLDRYFRNFVVARALGAGCVGTETGSCAADYSYSSRNSSNEAWLDCMRTLTDLARRAEDEGVLFAIEPVVAHVVSGPEKLIRAVREIASPALRVILDPANLVYTAEIDVLYTRTSRVVDELGDLVVAIHIKDLALDADPRGHACAPGLGVIDFARLFGVLKPLSPGVHSGVPMLFESLSPDAVRATAQYVSTLVAS